MADTNKAFCWRYVPGGNIFSTGRSWAGGGGWWEEGEVAGNGCSVGHCRFWRWQGRNWSLRARCKVGPLSTFSELSHSESY